MLALNLVNNFSRDQKNESTMNLLPRQLKLSEKYPGDGPRTPTVRVREVSPDVGVAPLRRADSIINRHQQPNFMILSAFLGLLLAVGHHAFYLKLNGTFTGSETRQQLAHTFGNILAISVATCLAFASRAAYKQYFWTVCEIVLLFASPSWRPLVIQACGIFDAKRHLAGCAAQIIYDQSSGSLIFLDI